MIIKFAPNTALQRTLLIAQPRVYETLAPNQLYTVRGTAWAGETEVTGVAVSTDGGRTWAEAEFLTLLAHPQQV